MIDKLVWDTNFFNLQIGKLNAYDQNFTAVAVEEAITYSQKNFDLSYLIINPENHEAIAHLKLLGYPIVDEKVTFVKSLDQAEHPFNKWVETNNSKHIQAPLLSLALQSGEFSRYKTDHNFPINSYEKLYTKWIEDSVNGRLADYVLVRKKDTGLVGFITLSIRSTFSEIGLLAVDKNNRGEGISKQLIEQAFHYSSIHKMQIIRVVTQLNNKIACRLYEQKGFRIEKIEYIYHIWKKHLAHDSNTI